MSQLNDRELLDLYFKTEKMEYLGILFKRYTKILIGVSLKYVDDLHYAEDIVQGVFIKFIDNINPSIQNIGGWLYFITKNESINFTKKNNKHIHHINVDESWDVTDSSEQELEIVLKNEKNYKILFAAVDELKPEQKQAITDFYLQNMSYEQVAQKNNWTLHEVKSHIQNGKRNLKIKLEGLIQTK